VGSGTGSELGTHDHLALRERGLRGRWMIAQATGVMRRSLARSPPSCAAIRLPRLFPCQAISLGILRSRTAVRALKLAAGAIACAATALATMTYQEGNQDTAAIKPVRNETIVLRQEQQTNTQTRQTRVSEDHESDAQAVPLNYARVVQTVRFFNPDASQNSGPKREPHALYRPTYAPTDKPAYRAEGTASWYGADFHGRPTANGERYDMHGISAAHRTMPLPSYARVTNLDNGRSIIVRVNNRGPFIHNRIIDLSTGTARALDFYRKGIARVRVEFVGRAPIDGTDDQTLLATLRVGSPAPAPSTVTLASAKPSR
jgi:rare lipoprotein A (peptidoglycan hydrolase)